MEVKLSPMIPYYCFDISRSGLWICHYHIFEIEAFNEIACLWINEHETVIKEYSIIAYLSTNSC